MPEDNQSDLSQSNQDIPNNAPDADATQSCTSAVPECKIDGAVVSCEKAVAYVVAESTVEGSVRSRCQEMCTMQMSDGLMDSQWILWDKTSCGTLIDIAGFPCSACCILPDVPFSETYCDGNPCKDFYCAQL